MKKDERLLRIGVLGCGSISQAAHFDACLAGKHVLVEKPLGTSVSECERVATLARQSGKIVQVGTMKRFDPGIQAAKRTAWRSSLPAFRSRGCFDGVNLSRRFEKISVNY
jgi:predicted dehydrogenase